MKNSVYFGWLLTALSMCFSIAGFAQFDDLYYNPDKDQPYHSTDYNSSNPDNYDYEDEYGYDDEEYGFYDDYDYYYASRIRRFHNSGYMFDFYDPYYTEMYYYDPFYYGSYYTPGVSIYLSFGNPYRPWRYYHRNRYYFNNYYSYSYYNSWCDPWSYNSWYDPWYGGHNYYYSSWNRYSYYNNYYGGYYGGYYGHPYGYGGYGYNNHYDNPWYYGGKNKDRDGKHFGSRYGGSTVSSNRGGGRDGGLIDNPGRNTDTGEKRLETPTSPRNTGGLDAGRNVGDFKGDRELNPDRGSSKPIIRGQEEDAKRGGTTTPGTNAGPKNEDTRTKITRETDNWKPFGNPGTRNNPGVNEGSRTGTTRPSEGVRTEEPTRYRDTGRTGENKGNDASRGAYNPSGRERTPAVNNQPSETRRSSENRSYTPSSGSGSGRSSGNSSASPSSGRSSESRSYSAPSRSSESRSYSSPSSGSSSSSRSSSSASSGSSSGSSSRSSSSGSSSSGSGSRSSSSSSGSTRSSGR
jgi:hypothetical protein